MTIHPKTMSIQTQIRTEVVTMTPDRASQLIGANDQNRPKRDHYVIKLANAMLRGEWQTNGDTIRVSNTGRLLDGQHRLSAIIKSGVSLEVVLVTGLSDSAFTTIDRGIARTTGDMMGMAGEKNYNILAAATALMHRLDVVGDPHHGNCAYAPTSDQQLAILANNPGLRRSASWSSGSTWCKRYATAGISAFCHYLFHRADYAAAESFFAGLETGAGLEPGSPILLLRSRLADAKFGKERIDKRYMTGLIFKAFKLHRDGAHVKALRIRTEGDSPERDIFVL
jgi:hypothetical protein